MLKIKVQLAILILLLPLIVAAKNAKLFPGYFLSMQGDTVKCNIEFEAWNKNPEIVHATGPQGPLELKPEETKGFGVYGYVDYISANVTYHTDPTSGTNLPDNYSDNTETKWCFLKILATGTFSLYELETTKRRVFFMNNHSSTPTELVYRVALRDGQVMEDQQFRNTLLDYFNQEGMGDKYNGRISRTRYSENDLLSLVKILDGNQVGNNRNARNSPGLEPFIFGGIQMYSFPSVFNGAHSLSEQFSVNDHFPPAFSPLLGIGLYYNLSPHTEKFWLGLSADYSSYNASVSKSGSSGRYFSQNAWDSAQYSEHIHGSNSLVSLNLFFSYVLNPDSRISYYLKGGVWYSFSLKKNPAIYSDYTAVGWGKANGIEGAKQNSSGQETILIISKSFGDFLAGAGAQLGQNRFELCYNLPSFTGRFNGTGTKFKIGSLSLAYIYSFKSNQHSNMKN